jgi:phosphatidylinositol glycan class S
LYYISLRNPLGIENLKSPLNVLHANGHPLSTNAFLIPQWGGVVIKNLDFQVNKVHLNVDDLKNVVQVFAEQLRILMGIVKIDHQWFQQVLPGFEIAIEPDYQFGVTGWEIDRLLRTRGIQNVMDSISTLSSLDRMLESLETLPVKDHLSDVVRKSLEAVELVEYTLYRPSDNSKV